MEAPKIFVQIIIQTYSLSFQGKQFESKSIPFLLKEEEVSVGSPLESTKPESTTHDF